MSIVRRKKVHAYRVDIIDLWSCEHEEADWDQPDWRRVPKYWLTEKWWLEFWAAAGQAARGVGWAGDISSGPYVCFLPDCENPKDRRPFVIGWKQSNNGFTFIASHHRLPWLEHPENDHGEC